MSSISVSAEREIAAPAKRVYRILADYQQHHPRILPNAFSGFRVEEGGIGAGTVIRIDGELIDTEPEIPYPGKCPEHLLALFLGVAPASPGAALLRFESTQSEQLVNIYDGAGLRVLSLIYPDVA